MSGINGWITALALLAALGSGLIAGVFFAFSSFVMAALARIPAAQGMAAMQSINVVVLNRSFLGVFLGTGALSLIGIVFAMLRWPAPGTLALLLGGTTYIGACLAVTIRRNVPLNESLAKVDPAAAGSAEAWERYVAQWTKWNHVRALASLVAAVLFILAFAA